MTGKVPGCVRVAISTTPFSRSYTAPRQRPCAAGCTGARKERIEGNPAREYVSTSHVERQNLTMRMHMRRFTRLANAFSKKFENHAHMVALYTVWYNFMRQHKAHRLSPAMAAGIADRLWSIEDIAELVEARRAEAGTARPVPEAQRRWRGSHLLRIGRGASSAMWSRSISPRVILASRGTLKR
jgi:hypothetical protein